MAENETTIDNLSQAINNSSSPAVGNNTGDSSAGSTSNPNSWLQTLPEDIRSSKSLAKFNDPNALAKSYLELEKSLDKRISLPADDANDEEWNKVFAKLGMPEDKKYILDEKRAELLKNNLADEDTLKLYEDLFHKGNLTKRQGERILEQIIESAKNSNNALIEAQKQARQANTVKFHEKYGDKSTEKLNILKATMAQHGSKELVDLVEESNYSPILIDLLLKLGESSKSDSLVSGKTNPLISTKEDAKKEIKRLESDKEFMLIYGDKGHAGYDEAIKKMQSLYDLAYNN